MAKINVKTVDGETMVWYMNGNVAVCADVTKQPAGWAVKFRGQASYCHRTKAEAVAIAKRWVKATQA